MIKSYLIIFLLALYPIAAFAGKWDDEAEKTKAGTINANKIVEVASQNKTTTATKNIHGNDNQLIKEKINYIKESAAQVFRICSPRPQALYKREGAELSSLKVNSGITRKYIDYIQGRIDALVSTVYAFYESPVTTLTDKQRIGLDNYNNDFKYSKMIDGLGDVGRSEQYKRAMEDKSVKSLNAVELIWYEYMQIQSLLESYDSKTSTNHSGLTDYSFGGSSRRATIDNMNPKLSAKEGLMSVGTSIQAQYPGSSLSCLNDGSGTLVAGLDRITYQDFTPTVIEEVISPYVTTWTVNGYRAGVIQLAIQRDANGQQASIEFVNKNGEWEANFRTINIGMNLTSSSTIAENIVDSWKSADGAFSESKNNSAQFTDDSATIKYLNWYYHNTYLPTCRDKNKRDIVGFFINLTYKDYAKSVLEAARPVDKQLNPKIKK